MSTSIFLWLVFILTAPIQICGLNGQSSEWNVQTIRRRVNLSNILESEYSKSLTGCASFCSNIVDIFVPALYFSPETGNCTCNYVGDEISEDEGEPEIVYGTRVSLHKIELTNNQCTRTTVWPYKRDCLDLFEDLYHDDCVYVIQPPGGSVTDTWCDMTNGGWTVIQRRMDGSEDFYRGWNEYATGFGNRTGEYWLGLENMHILTQDDSELVVYMEAFPGVTPSSMMAHYSHFKINNIESKYKLVISGFNGTCGNAMAYHNGAPFTTFDNDNDYVPYNCAVLFKGPWWHNQCHYASFNGLYYTEGNTSYLDPALFATGIHWYTCWNYQQSSKYAVMKIRRKP